MMSSTSKPLYIIYFLSLSAKGLQKAREVLVRDRLTPEEREEYDYFQDNRSRELSMMASARDEVWVEVDQKLAEKDAVIVEKDAALVEKDAVIVRERAEKEAAIAEKETLAAELAALKTRFNRE